jgi:hypothetical protein
VVAICDGCLVFPTFIMSMRKFLVIFFLSFYASGTLLFPLGDFSFAGNIGAIYNQCKGEDPDINIPDFVFEHLLNLGSIIAQFEQEADEENERPHQPLQLLQSFSQTLVTVGQPLRFEVRPAVVFPGRKQSYPLYRDDFIPHGFLSEVFRPPSV